MNLDTLLPGTPSPLGATFDGQGVQFAVYAPFAERVMVDLFENASAPHEIGRVVLDHFTHDVWHGYLPGLQPGACYGVRATGRFDPNHGLRFNSAKLLIDPYAKALTRRVVQHDLMLAYASGAEPDLTLRPDLHNSAPVMPRCVVVDPAFDWEGVAPPRTPLSESVIYEMHVRGFTKLLQDIPPDVRGTYAGLATEPAIAKLLELGVTAVELLPIHAVLDDKRLIDSGLTNYWGYNTIAFFAPEQRYAADPTPGASVREFQNMVKALHAAGIEVILDVVYNHTGEGNHLGPTLSFRGLSNAQYYRLSQADPRYYIDFTGTGNTVDVRQARALQLIVDSLRYWVTVMGVDGFRFDLASSLGRDEIGFHEGASFFDICLQDPVLSQVKLIAEPWDLGDYGYQVGGYPHPWSEWNGRYRDSVRAFWKGAEGQVGAMASRISGSSDIYSGKRKRPQASINFVTSHDGFTLADLVSYNHKHNHANGENNQDGDNHNNSWNCGVEGPTEDPKILALRARQRRNLLATLLLSQGVPMIFEGDEYGRTKNGNNNTYCQDNELNWVRWERSEEERQFQRFAQGLIAMRKNHPVFRRTHYFVYKDEPAASTGDLVWFHPCGAEMALEDWRDNDLKSLGMLLNGSMTQDQSAQGELILDDTFIVLLSAEHHDQDFLLPGTENVVWLRLIDTSEPEGFLAEPISCPARQGVKVVARSLHVYRLKEGTPEDAQTPLPNHPPKEPHIRTKPND
ncbi:MAG: glycogen debranching protein GlgX [Verrucomicrobiales bacterium]